MKRPSRTRFGLVRDRKTRKPIARRPRGGDRVYFAQPCRRCGAEILDARCACVEVRRDGSGRVLARKPGRPHPGKAFAAFTGGKVSA